MSRETSKANKRRIRSALFQKVFSGRGIEFGPGNDPLNRERLFPAITSLELCDIKDGNDAEHIAKDAATYDFIYSSHCLEHLIDPGQTLETWFSLLKPGGFLVLAVPDEDLYEQGRWPSRFNTSHRWTFTIHKQKSWSPVSVNILDLIKGLPECTILRLELVDTNYDYNLRGVDQTSRNAEAAIEVVIQKTGDATDAILEVRNDEVNIADDQFRTTIKALADASPFNCYHYLADFDKNGVCASDPRFSDYYKTKWAIAKALHPSSICEIGVRAGYSALAFLSAVPSARYLGLDIDRPIHGGRHGAIVHAAALLEKFNATIQVCDTQLLDVLPLQAPDLVHVDGNHDYECAKHDIILALNSGAKYILVDDIAYVDAVKKAVEDILTAYPSLQYASLESLRGEGLFYVPKAIRRNTPTNTVERKRVYCDFRQHRIGDKAAFSAVLKWYKDQHPQDWLIAVDDYWFENGKQRTIPSDVVFDGFVDECVYNTTPPNATRLEFGCVWLRLPWLAKQGYYPSIKVNNECEERLLSRFRWMSDPYVCVHILQDASYKRQRNHDFRQMAQLLDSISDHGAHVVRIGKWLGNDLRKQTDLTSLGLSIMESACIIKHSAAYIGGDTGMTHIASAVGVPWILAIYGERDDPRPWRKQALAMGCDVDFCALPSVPEERRSVFHMCNHRFPMARVVDTCTKRLRDLNVL